MSEPSRIRGTSTVALSILMMVIGVALVVRTLSAGGGALATGLILGLLFVLAGAGRLYLRRLTR
jgi:multisubunit Na+/H+ antiporter MnhB subunit